MEDIVKLSLLYDFYGALLTEKQREYFELHYFNDLSLNEIAQHFNVTRQGVFDIIHRSLEFLKQCEEKLGLVERYLKQKKVLERIKSQLEEIRPYINSEGSGILERAIRDLEKLVKEGWE
ncbi:MAG: YlxM family DNA-binding protein [Thermovenabulum sp.]|uniref:YlxM family DNA-binding protein n=1 Tax=Thermovenabulum sp. TaxID=3100335 RepID=UPI003C7B11CF